jgi:hypothetical protein
MFQSNDDWPCSKAMVTGRVQKLVTGRVPKQDWLYTDVMMSWLSTKTFAAKLKGLSNRYFDGIGIVQLSESILQG